MLSMCLLNQAHVLYIANLKSTKYMMVIILLLLLETAMAADILLNSNWEKVMLP